jgi:uncharacterized protein (DUF1697 family)
MAKFAAFLRGINVGGIKVPMPELKALFESLGFKNVKTYIQSGNVVFDSDKSLKDLKPVLEKALSKKFNYDAYVLLYKFEVLTEIIANYPFKRDDTHHAYSIFVDGKTSMDEIKALVNSIGDEEKSIAFGNGVIYWKAVKGGTLDGPFAKILAKAKFKSTTTNRNINTLEKMVEGAKV